MPPLPPGVSETRSAHARCPHRGAGRCGGSFGARLRVPKSAQSRGCGARGTSRRRFPPPLPKSSHCVESSRGGGLSCSVCLAASARGFCFVRGEKEAAVGRRVKGGGRGGREKKKSHRGQRRLGWPSRAGSEPGRLVAELGKVWESPPGGRGARTRCLHPGGTGRWEGCPSAARERVFP